MQDSAGDVRSVLAYLRSGVQYCQQQRRQDMEWEYQEAVNLVAARIYGPLPPRKKIVASGYRFHQPPNPELPPGFRPAKTKMPLRAITQVNARPHGHTQVLWETLSCGHELLAPVGYGNPNKSRRCIYCAFVAMSAAKELADKDQKKFHPKEKSQWLRVSAECSPLDVGKTELDCSAYDEQDTGARLSTATKPKTQRTLTSEEPARNTEGDFSHSLIFSTRKKSGKKLPSSVPIAKTKAVGA